MRVGVILGAAAAVLAVCASANAVAASIGDGGFETPVVPISDYQTLGSGSSLGDWSVIGGDVYLVNTNYHGFIAEGGAQWLSLSAALGSGVQQTIATDPGGSYTLKFWAGNALLGANLLKVTVGADTFEFTDVPGFAAWAQYSIPFSSVGALTTLTFYNGGLPEGRPGLDDISISSDVGRPAGVPEPATWAMMLAGFSGVGLAIRRRRSQRAAAAG